MATKNKGGRPAFKPTASMRRRVSIAAGGGMTHREIAIGLGITEPTLAKYFADELSKGAYSRRLEVMEAMHRAAVKGNVAAQKQYSAFAPASTLSGDEQPKPDGKDKSDDKAKGKKEIAQAEAQGAQAGTDWADLLPSHGNVTPIRTA